jgi:hypothetical protein
MGMVLIRGKALLPVDEHGVFAPEPGFDFFKRFREARMQFFWGIEHRAVGEFEGRRFRHGSESSGK